LERRRREEVDMEERPVAASPRTLARIGGVLYLIIIAVGLFDEAYVRDRIIVAGNAAATAATSGRSRRCGASGSLPNSSC
jgi:hypothetical protein